ncbi:hypothetical protein BVC80_9011g37 [Macleaya cordata]|uniref:Hydroxyproline-rich glycoprotein family protein n=1 Tax=Macleaya cordata TaxID=56857 RepID=A0A200QQ15_MACCD|nr:hypothetical protein BVC80_9011g37 [Macleaya cordata]
MMSLIALSLLVLLYAYCKQSSSTNSRQPIEDVEKPIKPVLPPPELEPKIAVIMAGDDKPRFLLKPIPSSSTQPSYPTYNQQEEV